MKVEYVLTTRTRVQDTKKYLTQRTGWKLNGGHLTFSQVGCGYLMLPSREILCNTDTKRTIVIAVHTGDPAVYSRLCPTVVHSVYHLTGNGIPNWSGKFAFQLVGDEQRCVVCGFQWGDYVVPTWRVDAVGNNRWGLFQQLTPQIRDTFKEYRTWEQQAEDTTTTRALITVNDAFGGLIVPASSRERSTQPPVSDE